MVRVARALLKTARAVAGDAATPCDELQARIVTEQVVC